MKALNSQLISIPATWKPPNPFCLLQDKSCLDLLAALPCFLNDCLGIQCWLMKTHSTNFLGIEERGCFIKVT